MVQRMRQSFTRPRKPAMWSKSELCCMIPEKARKSTERGQHFHLLFISSGDYNPTKTDTSKTSKAQTGTTYRLVQPQPFFRTCELEYSMVRASTSALRNHCAAGRPRSSARLRAVPGPQHACPHARGSWHPSSRGSSPRDSPAPVEARKAGL